LHTLHLGPILGRIYAEKEPKEEQDAESSAATAATKKEKHPREPSDAEKPSFENPEDAWDRLTSASKQWLLKAVANSKADLSLLKNTLYTSNSFASLTTQVFAWSFPRKLWQQKASVWPGDDALARKALSDWSQRMEVIRGELRWWGARSVKRILNDTRSNERKKARYQTVKNVLAAPAAPEQPLLTASAPSLVPPPATGQRQPTPSQPSSPPLSDWDV